MFTYIMVFFTLIVFFISGIGLINTKGKTGSDIVARVYFASVMLVLFIDGFIISKGSPLW